MKANELRIGNYVFNQHGKLRKVVASDFLNRIWLGFDPIPLTEEILEKCGFVQYINCDGLIRFCNDDSWYNVEKHGDKYPFYVIDEETGTTHYLCHDMYLHDFQNSYYQLNNEELTVNL